MADKILFPGTEMKVIEKYPDSWRLDHPDFGDVRKTPYAKGVIKEFKKLTDDPLTVAPLVKVEVDGQESDFIPLFSCPKLQYWDDATYKAKDFNQEKGYYEKAWMSFRGEDEVAVMLKESVPVAVVGLADGKPKIGEDIIKIQTSFMNPVATKFFHLRCSTQELYGGLDIAKTGPDGVALGLTEEIEPFSEYWHQPAPELYPSTGGGLVDYVRLKGYPSYRVARDYKDYYTEAIVPVGPILFIFQIFWAHRWLFSETGGTPGDSPGHWEPLGGSSGIWVNDSGVFVPTAGTQVETISFNLSGLKLRAGIYSKELYDYIINNRYSPSQAYADWYAGSGWNLLGTPYDNTYSQAWGDELKDLFLYTLFNWTNYPGWSDAKFYVRPHNG